MSLNKFKIPGVAFFGSWFAPLFPRWDCELHTVFGEGIQMPSIAEPSAEEVEKWHAVYVQGLVALFEKHKAEAGKGHLKLDVQ